MAGIAVIKPTDALADLAAATAILSSRLPTDLDYLGFFGVSAALSARNLVLGKPAASITGTLTYASNYVTIPGSGVAYIDTGVQIGLQGTLIYVGLLDIDGLCYYAGTGRSVRDGEASVTTDGFGLYQSASTGGDSNLNIIGRADGWTGTPGSANVALTASINPVIKDDEFHIISVSNVPGRTMYTTDHTVANTDDSTAANTTALATATIKIGAASGAIAGTYTQVTKPSFALYLPRGLAPDAQETVDMVGWIREAHAALGITA